MIQSIIRRVSIVPSTVNRQVCLESKTTSNIHTKPKDFKKNRNFRKSKKYDLIFGKYEGLNINQKLLLFSINGESKEKYVRKFFLQTYEIDLKLATRIC
jgi:hypothetical protein